MRCIEYKIHVLLRQKNILSVRGEDKITKEKVTALDLDKLVRAEKLQLLFKQSYPAIPISFMVAILLCVILWPVQQPTTLLVWLVILTVILFVRTLLFVSYWRSAPEGESVLVWEKPYFITLTVATISWGLGSIYIMQGISVLHQAAVYFFLVGMAGGAISVYSAHRAMTLATLAILLLPSSIWLLMQGDRVLSGMAISGIIFFISSIRSGKVLSKTLNRSFLLAHELKLAKEKAEELSLVDELSGLENRRAFYEKGRLLVDYCQRNGKLLSLIIMDIDRFKDINDNYGHAAGDEVIRQIGQLLKKSIRKSDIAARIGGEEFAILLEISDHDGAELLAEKLLKTILNTPVTYNSDTFTVSASFGISVCDCDLDKLFKRADEALYRAKGAGRSCVVVDGCVATLVDSSVRVELSR